jgi:hypothetical protein
LSGGMMEFLKDEIINSYKFLFEKFPELRVLPIYAWGRYYVYELAGDPFEVYYEGNFCCFKHMIKKRVDFKILKEIDDQIEVEKDEDLLFKIDSIITPDRDVCVKTFGFDQRAGRALIIIKNDDKFEIECIECDSPE